MNKKTEQEKNEEIHYAFGGWLDFVDKRLAVEICRVLSKFPEKIIKFAAEKCLFISKTDYEYAWEFAPHHTNG